MLRKYIFIVGFFLVGFHMLAQQQIFIIEGDTLQLKREIKGAMNLFYSTQTVNTRFFAQKKNRVLELTNDSIPGDDLKNYQRQLKELSGEKEVIVAQVQFNLANLKAFVRQYNFNIEQAAILKNNKSGIHKNLGFFTGLSNHIYTENPENILLPILGVELEFFDPIRAPRHSAFVRLQQSFSQSDFNYKATQLSLNYRFKALVFDKFDIHLNAALANFSYYKSKIDVKNEQGRVIGIKKDNGYAFKTPLSLGIGTDIKITENGYVSLNYNNFVSLILDSNGNFPIYLTLGFKYQL